MNETEKMFSLNEGDYDSRILYWGQITESGKCSLNFYRSEGLMTVELVAYILRPVNSDLSVITILQTVRKITQLEVGQLTDAICQLKISGRL